MDIDIEAQRHPTDHSDEGPSLNHESTQDQSSGTNVDPDGVPTSLAANQGHKTLNRLGAIFRSQPQSNPRPGPIDSSPNGYPKLSMFVASNDSFLIFRQFKYLQAQLLLNIQDQLREHETQLKIMERDAESLGIDLKSRQIDDLDSGARRELLEKIEERYEKYISLLSHSSSLALRAGPATPDYNNLQNFFYNYEPLADSEVYCGEENKEDLVALKPRGDTTEVDKVLRRFFLDEPHFLVQKLFSKESQIDGDSHILFFPRLRLVIAKGLVLGIPLMALLIGPIYPLFKLSSYEITPKTLTAIMFTQLGFTCVFAICLKFLTRPKRHELFAASVTYIGVLLVFMSQMGGSV